MSGEVIPFGKYKGRLVEEVLLDDPNYVRWLNSQPWFRDRYPTLVQIIINRGAAPEETPEHNAEQVRFLEDDFCLRFVRALFRDFDEQMRRQLDEQRARALKNIEDEIGKANDAVHSYTEKAQKYDDFISGRKVPNKFERNSPEGWQRDRDFYLRNVAEARAKLEKIEVTACFLVRTHWRYPIQICSGIRAARCRCPAGGESRQCAA